MPAPHRQRERLAGDGRMMWSRDFSPGGRRRSYPVLCPFSSSASMPTTPAATLGRAARPGGASRWSPDVKTGSCGRASGALATAVTFWNVATGSPSWRLRRAARAWRSSARARWCAVALRRSPRARTRCAALGVPALSARSGYRRHRHVRDALPFLPHRRRHAVS